MFAELQACARMAESEQREFAWHLVMGSGSFLRGTDWCHLQRDGGALAWERFCAPSSRSQWKTWCVMGESFKMHEKTDREGRQMEPHRSPLR